VNSSMLSRVTTATSSFCLHLQKRAYFVPGDGGRIVLTSALLSDGNPAATKAFVEHEQGHRRGAPLDGASPVHSGRSRGAPSP
jgi:Zn-dependent protease with chaperone function